ncbi:MAG TPA: hypothetical protein VHE13_16045, partial [Opitutus sp.]|nr:hypothetical protein [Opitutus sp.]
EDMRFSLINAPGKNAYPIGIVTWLLVDPQLKSHAKGRKLAAFLKWAYQDGEAMAPSVGFVAPPAGVRERILQRIDDIKF